MLVNTLSGASTRGILIGTMRIHLSFVTLILFGLLGIALLWQQKGGSIHQQAAISVAANKTWPAIGDPNNITQQVVEKPDGKVQVVFSITQDNLHFNDALNLTQLEYSALSPEDIQKMAWLRFSNWRAFTNQ